jgi:hypothetical protein
MHVSAAFSAKAKVSMSRFETTSYVNYEKLQSNIDIVRKRSIPGCSICFNFLSCLLADIIS